LALAVVCTASLAFAQPQAGTIGIFGDNQGMNCYLYDQAPGLTPYYIVHVYTPGATASQFAAPKPSCLGASWLSDTAVFTVTIGSSQTGVSVGYGTCRVGPIHVLTLNYFTMGTTALCCMYPVVADPTATPPGIYVVDCDYNLLVGNGCYGIVNTDGICHCATPAQETTWGQVKSLYVE
jgi:hypothetical protein